MKTYTVYRANKNVEYRDRTGGDADIVAFPDKAQAIAYARELNDLLNKLTVVGVMLTGNYTFRVKAITVDGTRIKSVPVLFDDLNEMEVEDEFSDDETERKELI
jgi:hypothetical protein